MVKETPSQMKQSTEVLHRSSTVQFSKHFLSKPLDCDVSQHKLRIGFVQFISYKVFRQPKRSKLNRREKNTFFYELEGATPARGSQAPKEARGERRLLAAGRAGLPRRAALASDLQKGRSNSQDAIQKPLARKENHNNDSDYLFFFLYVVLFCGFF